MVFIRATETLRQLKGPIISSKGPANRGQVFEHMVLQKAFLIPSTTDTMPVSACMLFLRSVTGSCILGQGSFYNCLRQHTAGERSMPTGGTRLVAASSSPPSPLSFPVIRHAPRTLRPQGKATQTLQAAAFSVGLCQSLDARTRVTSDGFAVRLWGGPGGALDIFSLTYLNSLPPISELVCLFYIVLEGKYVTQLQRFSKH